VRSSRVYGIPLTLFALAPWLERNYPGINPFAHDTGMLCILFFVCLETAF